MIFTKHFFLASISIIIWFFFKLFLWWITFHAFFSLVLSDHITALGSKLLWLLWNSCQTTTPFDSFSYWHLLTFFSHSICDFPCTWYIMSHFWLNIWMFHFSSPAVPRQLAYFFSTFWNLPIFSHCFALCLVFFLVVSGRICEEYASLSSWNQKSHISRFFYVFGLFLQI